MKNELVDELRDKVVELIEHLRALPAWQRTPPVERMLQELVRAVEQYDREGGE